MVEALCIFHPRIIVRNIMRRLLLPSIRSFTALLWTSVAVGPRIWQSSASLVPSVIITAGALSFASGPSLVQTGVPIVLHVIIRSTWEATRDQRPSTQNKTKHCNVPITFFWSIRGISYQLGFVKSLASRIYRFPRSLCIRIIISSSSLEIPPRFMLGLR